MTGNSDCSMLHESARARTWTAGVTRGSTNPLGTAARSHLQPIIEMAAEVASGAAAKRVDAEARQHDRNGTGEDSCNQGTGQARKGGEGR